MRREALHASGRATWPMPLVAATCALAGGLAYVAARQDRRHEKELADVTQSITKVLDSTRDMMDETDVWPVRTAIEDLQWLEAMGRLDPGDPARSVAEQLAGQLGASGAARDARIEVLEGRCLTWDDWKVSVRRLSDGGEPDKAWAGEWLMLFVSDGRRGPVRSMAAFTERYDTVWIRDGAADIDDVAASLEADAPEHSIDGAGWRATSIGGAEAEEELPRPAGRDDSSGREDASGR